MINISGGATLSLRGTYGITGTNQIVLPSGYTNSGGVLALGGTITNAGTISTSASLTGDGAALTGGTLLDASGGFFHNGGSANNVALAGNINMTANNQPNSTYLYLNSGSFAGIGGAAGTISVSGTDDSVALNGMTLAAGTKIGISGTGNGVSLNAPSFAGAGSISITGTNNVLTFTGRTLNAAATAPLAVMESAGNTVYLASGLASFGAGTTLQDSGSGVAYLNLGNNASLTNGGQILANSAGGTLNVQYFKNNNYVSPYILTNIGSIAASAGGAVTFGATGVTFGSVVNLNTISASGSASIVDFSQARLLNQAGGALYSGTYTASGGGQIKLGIGAITTLAADVRISDAGSGILVTGSAVALDAGLTSIIAGGALREGGARSVSNSNSLSVAGLLQLAGASYRTAGLTIAAGGEASGFGRLAGAVVDNNLLDAQGGTLLLTGGVSGSGQLAIGNAATLEFGGAVAAGMAVNFAGSNATLRLDNAALFHATLAGFSAGDRIDIANTTITAVSTFGTLVRYTDNGGNTHLLKLAGKLSGGTLSLSADGAGGTYITAGTGVVEAAMALPVLNDIVPGSLAIPSATTQAPASPAGAVPSASGGDAAAALGLHQPSALGAGSLPHLGPVHPF